MWPYKNEVEFSALIAKDVCTEIFNQVSPFLHTDSDLDSLFVEDSNHVETLVSMLYQQAIDSIPTHQETTKYGTIDVPDYKPPKFNYKRFENDVIRESLLRMLRTKQVNELNERLEEVGKQYSPDGLRWLKACKKLFYNIKPSKNSIYYLQSFALQVKNQILKRPYSNSNIMLMLLSQSDAGYALGGCGKSFLVNKIHDWIIETFGPLAVGEASELPSQYTTFDSYSKNLFMIISDPQVQGRFDYDVSALNNIIDKSQYTRNEKYVKNETLTSMANLIVTTNYSFSGRNQRRIGEVHFWPVNINSLIEQKSDDVKYVLPISDFAQYIQEFFFNVPDELIFDKDWEASSTASYFASDTIAKFNMLFSEKDLDDNGFVGISPFVTEQEVSPSVVAELLRKMDPDFKWTARNVFEQIFCRVDGKIRFECCNTNNKPQYRKYKIRPIVTDAPESTLGMSMLEQTAKWWSDIICTYTPPTPPKKESKEEENVNANIDLAELRLPAFKSRFDKQPHFDKGEYEFFVTCPYTQETIENALAEGNAAVSRGRDCMEPLGFVFESDDMPIEDQKEQAAKLVAAFPNEILGVVHSGGKSLHITAILEDEYSKREKDIMRKYFKDLWAYVGTYLGLDVSKMDAACANIGRLTRYPNGKRENGASQQAVYWNNDARLKLDIHKWCSNNMWRMLVETMNVPTFDNSKDTRDDYTKLMACKNCSDSLKLLQEVAEGNFPKGANYYAAFCAGKGIQLSKEFILGLAENVHKAHPSNIANPRRTVEEIYSRN